MIAGGESGVLIVGAITVVASGVLVVLSMTALAARALFVACVTGALMSAVAGLTLMSEGASAAAIAVVVLGVCLFPTWLLGGMVLSANAAKDSRRRGPWLISLAALATAAVILAASPELITTANIAVPETAGLPALLAALMFVAGVCVIGLIGYGERGALSGVSERRERDAP